MWNNYGAIITLCLLGAYLTSQPIQYWTINNPANAWTSLIYAFPVVPLYVKAPLYVLAIASFSLWANSNAYNRFVDVTSIFWIPIITAIYIHPTIPHKMRIAYCVNFAFASFIGISLYTDYFYTALRWYDRHIVPSVGAVTVASYLVVFPYYCRVKKYQFSGILTLAGFAWKTATIYGGFYYGTALFHTLTALSLCLLVNGTVGSPTLRERGRQHLAMVHLDKCERICLV